MRSALRSTCLLTALCLGAACRQEPSPAPTAPVASVRAATVNGAAITEAEVAVLAKGSAHGEASATDQRKAVLDGLVRDELLRQEAVKQGLTVEPAALEELARAEALASIARRKAYADAYLKQALERAEPTEAEARAFFEQHGELVRTEFRVQQLFLRDEAQLRRAHQELVAGAPFEDVARRLYPDLPAGVGTPWELGFLAFKQLPEAWRPALATLQPGQFSDVLKGPNGRFWIIKLVEKRPRSSVTFEEVKPFVLEDLRRSRLETVPSRVELELRKWARITEP